MEEIRKKKELRLMVREETWEEFRNWVQEKHGSTYAMLGMEVENALKEHMQKEQRKEKDRAGSENKGALDRIEGRIQNLSIEEQDNMPLSVILRFIREEAGTDPRTTEKYIKLLERDGFLPEGTASKLKRRM